MPHSELNTTVAKPLEHVAAVLTAPEADQLYAPAIFRITLDASTDGRAADLTYEQLHTTASRASERTEEGRGGATCIGSQFTGPGATGRVTYRLIPQNGATELVQRVRYEFAEWATIGLLEPATTTHNHRQFSPHLTTVKDRIETEGQETPTT